MGSDLDHRRLHQSATGQWTPKMTPRTSAGGFYYMDFGVVRARHPQLGTTFRIISDPRVSLAMGSVSARISNRDTLIKWCYLYQARLQKFQNRAPPPRPLLRTDAILVTAGRLPPSTKSIMCMTWFHRTTSLLFTGSTAHSRARTASTISSAAHLVRRFWLEKKEIEEWRIADWEAGISLARPTEGGIPPDRRGELLETCLPPWT